MTTILSVSIPDDLQAPLDAVAARQRRSRSFVVSEAVRAYVASHTDPAFDDARDETLREGLALSPAERVRLAESLAGQLTRGSKRRRPFVMGFDTFAEYEEWLRKGAPIRT
jgi:predicted transcriptional regulator